MTEPADSAQSQARVTSSRLAAIVVMVLVALVGTTAIVVWFWVRPRAGAAYDGLIYVDYSRNQSRYEFFPAAHACPPQGVSYHLVPNENLAEQMTFLPGHYLQGAWHAKLKGDLSSVGFYGDSGNYWRELTVTDVYEVTEIDCSFQ